MTFFPARRSRFALALLSCLLGGTAMAVDAQVLSSAGTAGTSVDSKAASGIAGQLLCAPAGLDAKAAGLGLYDTGRGLTLAPVKAGQACSLMATAAGLNIQFAGQGPLLLAGPVNYRFDQTPRRVDVLMAEPQLCESYYTGTDLLALRLTDTNGVEQPLRGFRRVDYTPSSARFLVEAALGEKGPMVQCYAFPFASLTANPPPVPAPQPVNPDLVFASGFDDGPNLKLELLNASGALAIRELDVARDQAFQYQIRVTNAGAIAASGVRIREFVPTNAQLSLIQPVVGAGDWQCVSTAGACSGGENGTGALSLAGLTLAAGEVRTYTLTRTVSSGEPPQRTLLSAALFFDPGTAASSGDVLVTDNAAPLVLELVPNQAPEFACSYPARSFSAEPTTWSNDLPVNVVMDEAGAPVEFECRVRDRDNEAFSLADPVNGDPTLVLDDGLVTALAADRFDVRIAAFPDRIGSTTVTRVATDARTATGQLRVNVEVRDVNSPPSFALKGSIIELPTSPGLPRIFNRLNEWEFVDVPDVLFGTGCDGASTCVLTFPDFVLDRSVGLPPELPQNLTPSISCTQAGTGSAFLEPGSWAIAPASANSVTQSLDISFKYRRSSWSPPPSGDASATCTVTLTDSGSPQQSFSQTLTIRYLAQ